MNRVIFNIINFIKINVNNAFKKGFFHLLFSNYLVQFIAFSSQIIVALFLRPEDIGRIKIMQTIIYFFSIIGGLGFKTSVLKLCSEKININEKLFLFKKAYLYTLVTLLVLYPVIIILSFMKILSSDNIISGKIPIYALILFPMVLIGLDISLFQALRELKKISVIQSVSKVFAVSAIVTFSYLWGIDGYIYGVIIGSAISNILIIREIKKYIKEFKPQKVEEPFKMHWKYARFSFLSDLITSFSMYADIYLLNFLVDDRAMIGQYSFALILLLGPQTLTSTIEQMIIPSFSEKSKDMNEWKKYFNKYNKIFLLLSGLLTVFCFFLLPMFTQIIFGDKYLESQNLLKILIIAWFFRNLYSLKGSGLIGIGRLNSNFYAALLSLPFCIITSIILIKSYGVLGAAYSTILVAIIRYMFVSFQFNRGINNYEKTLLKTA